MLPTEFPPHAVATAAETAGNSTVILLLCAHLHQRGLIDPSVLADMVERAERQTHRDTPLLAGSAVVGHTLAWLQAQAG